MSNEGICIIAVRKWVLVYLREGYSAFFPHTETAPRTWKSPGILP